MGATTIKRDQREPALPVLSAERSTLALEWACRTLDVVIAILALVLLLPVLAVIAVAVRLDSPGPVIFRQRRVGKALRPFTVLKFRTMWDGASPESHRRFVVGLISGDEPPEVAGQPRFKLTSDSRITRVGAFLRRTSLDELPQLWNVIRGEMSLVGPRPAIQYEVEHYPPHWFERFEVKPGVTGLWQVSGRCELNLEDMIGLDAEYVRQRSLKMNLWILLRTVPAVFTARGAR